MVLTACEPKATVRDLERVEKQIDATERDVRIFQSASQRKQSQIERSLQDVQYRQAATEAAFVQMGRGFNELSESVVEVHEQGQKAIASVEAVRKDLQANRSLAQQAAQPEVLDIFAQRWIGSVRTDLSSRTEPTQYLISDGMMNITTSGRTMTYRLETIGERLYAVATQPPPETGTKIPDKICLQILERKNGTFVASECASPLEVIEFNVP